MVVDLYLGYELMTVYYEDDSDSPRWWTTLTCPILGSVIDAESRHEPIAVCLHDSLYELARDLAKSRAQGVSPYTSTTAPP